MSLQSVKEVKSKADVSMDNFCNFARNFGYALNFATFLVLCYLRCFLGSSLKFS